MRARSQRVRLHYKAEKEFKKLSKVQQNKILQQFAYINEFGSILEIPDTKKLKGTALWEIRILGKDNIRLLYHATQKNIVVLRIFKKKSQKTPKGEILKAYNRLRSSVLD